MTASYEHITDELFAIALAENINKEELHEILNSMLAGMGNTMEVWETGFNAQSFVNPSL